MSDPNEDEERGDGAAAERTGARDRLTNTTTVEAARLLLAFWLADRRAPGWLQRLVAGLPVRRKWHVGWDSRQWRNEQAARKAAQIDRAAR